MAAAVLVEQDRLEALWVKASTRTRKGMGQQYNSRREQLGRFHAQCTRLDRLLLGRGKGENGEGGDIRRESVLIQALEHAAGEQDADCTRHTRCRLHSSYQMPIAHVIPDGDVVHLAQLLICLFPLRNNLSPCLLCRLA